MSPSIYFSKYFYFTLYKFYTIVSSCPARSWFSQAADEKWVNRRNFRMEYCINGNILKNSFSPKLTLHK